jgi:triphosphoribosyl-dephospho-CoA synthetase
MEPGDVRLHSYAGLSGGAAANLLAVGVGLLLITRRRSGSPA